MSAAAQIVYLRLDADYDPVFQTGAELSNLDAVAQAIKTRLLLFQGEWWENLNEGTPMFQQIIGQRASKNGQQIMALALANRVAGTPYVSAVEDVAISFDEKTRSFSFRCTAQTSFGTVPVTFSPGLNASLG
jgi:hypothetical protein